ncbi:MAG: hypothetical protein IPN11_15850 [Opitutaceae bacterium]|nr:hypothetical protein [Opitutaceae bacterium]
MKTPTAARVLSFFLLLASPALPVLAAPFSAELVDSQGDQTRTGPFHYQDGSYRFEVGGPGHTLIVMVDGKTGILRMLNPAAKAYIEAGPADPMSIFASPFALYARDSQAKANDVRTEGTESIGGILCKKQVVSRGEQHFVTGWVSDAYELPLKVLTQLDARTVELRNIKPGPQDPALFTVPADYKLEVIEERRDPQPEWAGKAAGAPLLTPPFEKSLATGEIVRVRPQAGRWIKIEGTNTSKVQGSFTSAPFKDGEYTGGGSMNTVILDAGDSGAVSIGASPDTTDALVVHVGEGSMKIRVAYVAPSRTGPYAEPAAEEPAASKPAAPAEETAEISGPESVEIATRVEITWQGPANRDDYISIARPNQAPGAYVERTLVREGNPLKVWTPSDPGDYEVRYVVARGYKVLAKVPLAVTAVAAKVEPAGPVNVGGWVEVKWEGPARDGDFISVASANQSPGAFIGRTAVKEGNPVKVRAASDPGEYEVRYVLAHSYRQLAKAPLTVNPVTAEVTPPATAAVGAEFEVKWQGPGYPEDYVSIARTIQAPGAYLNSTTVKRGNPLKLRAPKEPGTYEVRYILGRGHRLLGKKTITITAP